MLDQTFETPKPKVIAGAKHDWELVIGMEQAVVEMMMMMHHLIISIVVDNSFRFHAIIWPPVHEVVCRRVPRR